jgi:cytosine deaminase
MHLPSAGITAGADASFLLLQARDVVEAIRLRANRLKVWRKGQVVAQTPEVMARLDIGEARAVTFCLPAP